MHAPSPRSSVYPHPSLAPHHVFAPDPLNRASPFCHTHLPALYPVVSGLCSSLSLHKSCRHTRPSTHTMHAFAFLLLLCALLAAAAAQDTGTGSDATTSMPGTSGTSDTGSIATTATSQKNAGASANSTAAIVFCPEPTTFFSGDGITFPDCEIHAGTALERGVKGKGDVHGNHEGSPSDKEGMPKSFGRVSKQRTIAAARSFFFVARTPISL